MIDWLALSVAAPLLGSVATVLAGAGAPSPGTRPEADVEPSLRIRRRVHRTGILAILLSSTAGLVTAGQVWLNGPLRSELGGWGVPLGIALGADGLSASMLGMTSLVALGISIYATGYFCRGVTAVHFWPLWLLLLTALNGLFIAGDLFNLYVMLELLGLAAAALGALTGSRDAVSANLRYLLVGLLGSMVYLFGIALIYTGYGELDIGLVRAHVAADVAAGNSVLPASALVLMTAGLALKAALFPMHFWLPPAHANAPAPVSAALSALVVKAAFYLILRLWLDGLAPAATEAGAVLIGLLGAGAVLWGSWQALRAARLKLLAAYSTVAQIGYLCLFFPLLVETPAGPLRENLTAALLLMALTHGLAKAGLFLAAGLVQHSAGHDRIDELGGTAQNLPATTFTIALAGTALIGLPPSGSFVGKWVLMQGAIAQGQWWWVAVIAIGTLLAAAYVFRVLSRAFGLEPTPRRFVTEVRTELPAFLLALGAVAGLGLGSGLVWDMLASAPVGAGG
jgi:formate hydrogenlyase subunit 3/multisubunit Na+/H+ antiporter MnhD subunit